jgi:hypothetical protein
MAYTIKGFGEVVSAVRKVATQTGYLYNKTKAAGLIIDTDASSLLKYNQAGTTRTVVSLTGTQTLTNKTLGANTLNAPIVGDTQFCTTQTDRTSSTTLQDVTGMTAFALVAGATYEFELFIMGTSVATGGLKVALTLTTATLTSANYNAKALLAASLTDTQGTTATSPVPLHGQTQATLGLYVTGRLVVNAGGTAAVQMAQNFSDGTASSVYVGSWVTYRRVS